LLFVASGWAVIYVIARTAGIGVWGLSGTGMTWVVLNTVLFFAASLIAWRMVVPKLP
jgi:hypothetical protein